MRIRSFASLQPFWGGVSLTFLAQAPTINGIPGARYVCLPLSMEGPLPDSESCDYVDPTVRLGQEGAQELMDELWRVGVRPSEGTGSAGSLAATERHLQDMRKLVPGLVSK
jgi:hypothetical protein